ARDAHPLGTSAHGRLGWPPRGRAPAAGKLRLRDVARLRRRGPPQPCLAAGALRHPRPAVLTCARAHRQRGLSGRVKLGILAWTQFTDWPSLRDAGVAADTLGFDSLWAWDHVYPIFGDPEGPIFEGYVTLAGWAGVTTRVTLGLLVGAIPFRNPALV